MWNSCICPEEDNVKVIVLKMQHRKIRDQIQSRNYVSLFFVDEQNVRSKVFRVSACLVFDTV